MTTAAQVQAGYAAANRGQTLDTASATAIAAQIDASGGTFTLNNYITQQFELNQNSTGLALEIFQAIVGKTEASAADLTQIANTLKSFSATYAASGQTAAQLPQDIADDLGMQLADNATGTTFRATNNLSGLYGPTPTATTATFDVNGFVSNWLTNVFGASAVTGTAVQFETARFLELANRFKGFTDANDTTGYVRAAGALVAELINQGEQANNGNYHNPAVAFIQADATGSAPYGGNLLATGGTGTGGSGASTGIAGNVAVLTAGADVFPTSTLPNTNDDYINGWATTDTLTGNDNINAGPGLDILAAQFTAGNTLATAIQPSIQNTELQFFKVNGAATEFIDTTLDIGAQQIWNENSGAGSTLNLLNLASTGGVVTPTIGIEGTAGSTTAVTLAGGVTNATLNVALDNATGTLTTTGVKVENISVQLETGNALIGNTESAFGVVAAAGTNTNTLTLTPTDTLLTSVVVKGAGALTLIEGNANVQGSLTSVDASALGALAVSKGLTFNEVGSTASSMTVLGSNAADTLTFKTGQVETVQGNGGADNITLGNAATDKATLVYKLATDSNGLAADQVTAFFEGNGTADKIDVKAFNFTGANAITAIATTTGTNPGSDTASLFTTAGSQAVYDTGNNTLYLDVNHDGNYSAASDLAIHFIAGGAGTLGTVGVVPKVTDFIFS